MVLLSANGMASHYRVNLSTQVEDSNVLVMGKEDRRGRYARGKGVHWDS